MFQVYLLHTKELLRNRFLIISSILIPLILYPLIYFGIQQFFAIKMGIMEKQSAEIAIVLNIPAYSDLKDSLALVKNLKITADTKSDKPMQLTINQTDGLPVFNLRLDSTNVVQTGFAAKIRPKLVNYFEKKLKEKIQTAQKPENYYRAFVLKEENIADKNEVMTKILSLLIPMFSIIAILGVASAVAVEVTAGEKENKAAETLFVTPLSRTKIIWGKILVITSFSVVGGLINFTALGIVVAQVMQFFFKQLGGRSRMDFDIARIINPQVLLLVLFALIIISFIGAVLFAGMASFAKNRKEANVMMSPVSTVLMFSSYIIVIPGLEGNPILPFLPIINISMSLKMAISGDFNTIYVIKTVVSSVIYLLICFKYILPAMADEDVLFGNTETSLWKKIKADLKK